MPVILLLDNGSVRASATIQLRNIADALSKASEQRIHPVSLKHANKIKPEDIENKAADIFYDFMQHQLSLGQRSFILLPLFFGRSKALTSNLAGEVTHLQQEFGEFELKIADVIYPLPDGEQYLIEIIYDHILGTAEDYKLPLENMVLVDHGSPVAAVTDVRKHLAAQVQHLLGSKACFDQAVMERRDGAEYDFNGDLLRDWLTKKAQSGEKSAIVVLLFFLPGRHAGSGGDIIEICERIKTQHPDFKIGISPLVSEHKHLVSILHSRLQSLID